MKKRIVSMMLLLAFVVLALPMGVSAGQANANTVDYESSIDDWSAKLGQISALDGGVFKINAWDANSATSNTLNPKHARLAMWNGSLAEGKFSVTLDTASIFARRAAPIINADGSENWGANDTGIIFGGSGIKAYSGNGNMNVIENNSQFYFLYFSNNSISLALADKTNYIDNDGDGTAETQKSWLGTQKNENGANLQVDLNVKYNAMWTAAKNAGEVEITVAFSANGALRVWINGVHITQLDTNNLTPFGTELGIRCGMGYHVNTEVRDFKIHGGLTLKNVAASKDGTVVYDADTYTFKSVSATDAPYNGGSAVAYFTNRYVPSGKIVIMAQQVPDIVHTNTACETYNAGELCTANHYQNYYTGAIFNASGVGNYYMLSMKDTQSTRSNAIGPGAVSYNTRLSANSNGTWEGDPSGIAWKVVQHLAYDKPYTPADPITFNASTGTITWPSGTTDKFNGTNPSVYQVATWTDPTPLTGGYYGFRSDVHHDALIEWMDTVEATTGWASTSPRRAANEGCYIQYYVINDEEEAIDLSLDTGNLDLTNLEKNKDYEVVVSTYPAGSVINSGDTISMNADGVKTISTRDNGDGTYTVKFRATKDGAVKLAASVDNHIFGTLTTDAAEATVIDTGITVPTGDATFVVGAGVALAALLGTAIVVGKKRTVA